MLGRCAVRASRRRHLHDRPHRAPVGVLLCLLLLLWPATLAAEAGRDGPGAGTLLFVPADGSASAAPLLATDVAITVTGPIARTTITQHFWNPTDAWISGRYLFPLPERAAIDGLTLIIGQRVIQGEIQEKHRARATFAAAQQAGKGAGLLAQHRPNVFTTEVANIGPGESVVVQIEYQEMVKRDGATFSLRVPLVVAPRYQPAVAGMVAGAPTTSREAMPIAPVLDPALSAPLNPVTVALDLAPGMPLAAITSAQHAVTTREIGDGRWRVELAQGPVAADRDFALSWRAHPDLAPTLSVFREQQGDATYVLAQISPPAAAKLPPAGPRAVTFLLDASGSMAGPSFAQAKAALVAALNGLNAGDRFNVIRFSDGFTALFDEPAPVQGDSIAAARRALKRWSADGGTEMLPALRHALATPPPAGMLHQIVLVTDGAIGNEPALFDLIAHNRGQARLFPIGIGSAPNSHLLRRAAELGRGSFLHIDAMEQIAAQTGAVLRRLERPVLTGLSARITGAAAQISPDPLPDLYAGEPLVILARLPAGAAGQLQVAGQGIDGPWRRTLPVTSAPYRPGIGKLWARGQIADAEAARHLGRMTWETADQRILSLALEHGLMSRLTSLVAVDRSPVRPADAPLVAADLPINLPAGWDFNKIFGGSAVPPRDPADPLPTPIAAPARVLLPQTGSPAALNLAGGTGLVLLGCILLWLARRRPA